MGLAGLLLVPGIHVGAGCDSETENGEDHDRHTYSSNHLHHDEKANADVNPLKMGVVSAILSVLGPCSALVGGINLRNRA